MGKVKNERHVHLACDLSLLKIRKKFNLETDFIQLNAQLYSYSSDPI